MPDKEMSAEDFEDLKELIEDNMEIHERAQRLFRGQTGVDYVRPLRLAPRKRKETREPSTRDRLERLKAEAEAIEAACEAARPGVSEWAAQVARDGTEILGMLTKSGD